MPIIAAKYEVEFLKKEQAAKNTCSVFFARPAELDFLPGQFMRLTLNLPQTGERGNSRFFSIASSPTEKEYLMITIRTNGSDFKKTLLELNPGAKVRIEAPYGVFILKTEEAIPHVLLAGGIGITPFRSMIRYAADMNLNIPITLFTSFSTVEDIVFQKELKQIAAKHTWFKIVETISRPENSKLPWTGNTGRINADLLKKNVPGYSSSVFYIAGPPAMVDALENVLKTAGTDNSRIRKEKFTGY